MNREEARRILLACRSGTSDMEDPEVRAALELAARDPELAEWWRDQCRVQESLRSAFRNLPVPADLKDSILAANKVVSVGWWRTTGFRAAALAAVLVLLLSMLVWRPSDTPTTFDDFRDRMVRMVIREYRMDITTANEMEVREFLGGRGGHAGYQLPGGIADVPLFGAGRLSWNGQPVSMVCFERGPDDLLYLFVIDRSVFPAGDSTSPGERPEFAEVVEHASASWAAGDQAYLLITEAGPAILRQLVN